MKKVKQLKLNIQADEKMVNKKIREKLTLLLRGKKRIDYLVSTDA